MKTIEKPFVVIYPYQVEGDLAFGIWLDGHYLFGDGDSYSVEELEKCWPDSIPLTWTELESLLKKTKQ
jgi:hypothetical protein